MKTKVYFISCDDKTVYNTFATTIGYKILRMTPIDVIDIEINALNNFANRSLHVQSAEDIKLVNQIAEIIDHYNGSVFKMIVDHIDRFMDGTVLYIFVRINDIRMINKLKRYYKRDNYRTIRIDNTIDLDKKLMLLYKNYKFDNRITYDGNTHFKNQIKLFMSRHINSIEYLNLNLDK